MQPTTTPPSAERLLASEEERLAVFPIRYPQIWARYKKALASLWVAGEVDLSKDPADWKRLTDGERHFLSHVLGFFASADGIVNDNLAERFGSEVKIREAKFFYDLQKMMENIHSEMYSLLIDTLIAEPRAPESNGICSPVSHISSRASDGSTRHSCLMALLSLQQLARCPTSSRGSMRFARCPAGA